MNLPLVVRWRRAIQKAVLSSTEKLVAYTLAQHMNADGSSCYPSQALLAEECGLSERTVWSAVRSLDRKGWLRRFSRGRRKSHTYSPKFPDISFLNAYDHASASPATDDNRVQ